MPRSFKPSRREIMIRRIARSVRLCRSNEMGHASPEDQQGLFDYYQVELDWLTSKICDDRAYRDRTGMKFPEVRPL